MRKDKEQFIGSIYGYTGRSYAGCVWDVSAISPMLSTMQGGGREPHIMEVEKLTLKVFNLGSENPEYVPRAEKEEEAVTLVARDYKGLNNAQSNSVCEIKKLDTVNIKQATEQGYIECCVPGVADLDYPDSDTRRGMVLGGENLSPTLTTSSVPYLLDNWIWEIDGQLYRIRIRKLTPKECWRLMDFNHGAFDKAEQVNSNTQLYKQAGNSIVVNCLVAILGQLFEGHEEDYRKVEIEK